VYALESTMGVVKLVILKTIIYGIALFWAWVSTLKLAFEWLKRGNAFWEVKERSLPPAILQDTRWGKHSYIKLKDIKLHYVENGDKSKPLLLFVHGFPEFWFSWRHQLEYFAKTHWVVAIDMRGYGDSDKPAGVSKYAGDLLQGDIVDVVHSLGRKNCILVAHDWGGAIAWTVAAKFPQVVQKLIILNAPHPTAFGILLRSSIVQFLKSWYIFLFQLPYFPEMNIFNDDLGIFRRIYGKSSSEEEIEAYKYTFSTKDAWTPPINYYRSALAATLSLEANKVPGQKVGLPKIKVPTLIIWGENDLALDKKLPEMTKPFVDNLKIEFIPGGNHFIQVDKPNEVNKLIESFI